jgi:hypothetical protein
LFAVSAGVFLNYVPFVGFGGVLMMSAIGMSLYPQPKSAEELLREELNKKIAELEQEKAKLAEAQNVIAEWQEYAQKMDAAVPGQLNFQTPATEIMEKIVDLHHDLMFFIIVIVVFVS